jgi:hypothetical protein
MDLSSPELSESADEQLADDVETLTRGIVKGADFSLPDAEDDEMPDGMDPQMQMLAQSFSATDVINMVMPHLRYMVAEDREEALEVLESIERNARELREHHA